MQLWELANAAAIYSVGFIAIFVVFALLYRRALSRREELGLSELEVFDARTNIAHHLISASVGVLSLAMASFAPLELAPIAPTAYCLMGPVHYGYGSISGKKRRALEASLAGDAAPDFDVSVS